MKERIFSTHAVAEMMGINPSSVVRWIEAGKLRAFKTPGGHRRVREPDLRTFFTQFSIPVPGELSGAPAARRLLVVDPDGRQGAALARSLRKADHALDVTTVSDTIDALVRVGVEPPQVLIVDGGNTVDPLTIAKALKGQAATAGIALIVIVSKADAEAEKKLKNAGARAILTRPATAEQILAAL